MYGSPATDPAMESKSSTTSTVLVADYEFEEESVAEYVITYLSMVSLSTVPETVTRTVPSFTSDAKEPGSFHAVPFSK